MDDTIKITGIQFEISSDVKETITAMKDMSTVAEMLAPIVAGVNQSFAIWAKRIAETTVQMERLGALGLGGIFSTFAVQAGVAGKSLNVLRMGLKKATSGLASFAKEIAYTKLESLHNNLTRIGSALNYLFIRFVRIATYRTIRSLIKNFNAGVLEGIQNLYTWSRIVDSKFSPAMDSIKTNSVYVKNSFAAMVSPIIESLAPAFDFLVSKIVSVMNAFNKFFATLTGKTTWTKATKQTQQWADVTSDSAKKATKAFKPFLLDIDELNKLPSKEDTENSISSPSGDAVDAYTFSDQPLKNNDFAKQIADAIKDGKWEEAGKVLADKLNTLTDALDSWINGTFAPKAKEFATDMARFLNGFIAEYSWNKLGKTFADGLNAIVGAGYAFITTFNWQKFGNAIGSAIDGFIKNVNWKLLGNTFGSYINGLVDTLRGALNVIEKNAAIYAQLITNGINAVFDTVKWKKLGDTFGRLFNTVMAFIDTAINTFNWNSIGRKLATAVDAFISKADFSMASVTFADGINGIFNGLDGALSVFAGKANYYGTKIGKAVNAFFEAVGWEGIGTSLSNLVNTTLQNGFSVLEEINWEDDSIKLSRGIDSMLKNTDWTALANTLGSYFNGVLSAINGGIAMFAANAPVYGANIGNALNTLTNKIDWDTASSNVTLGISGVFSGLVNAIELYDWDNLGHKIFLYIDKTFTGIDWELIAETLAEGMNSIITVVSDVAKGWTDNAGTYGAKIGHAISTWLNSINWSSLAQSFADMFNGIVKFLSNAVSSMDWNKLKENVTTAINSAIKSIDAAKFGKAVNDTLSNILDMVSKIDWYEVGYKIGQFLGSIDWVKVLTTVGKAIYAGLQGALEGFFNTAGVSELWQMPAMAFITIGPKIFSGLNFGSIAKIVFTLLKNHMMKESGTLDTVWPSVGQTVESGAGEAMGFIADDSVLGTVSESMGTLGTTISAGLPSITGALGGIVSSAGAFLASPAGIAVVAAIAAGLIITHWDDISKALSDIGKKLGEAWDTIKKTASDKWNDIKSTVTGVWDSFTDSAGQIFGNVKKAISDKWSDISSSVKSTWNTMKGNAGDIFSTIKSTITGKTGAAGTGVKKDFKKMGTDMKGADLDDIADDISSDIESSLDMNDESGTWGKDLTKNFADGINSMASTVSDVVSGIADIVSGLLHHSTPDEGPLKNDDEWGADFMDNLITSISSKKGDLETESENVADTMKTVFSEDTAYEIEDNTDIAMRAFDRLIATMKTVQADAKTTTTSLTSVFTADNASAINSNISRVVGNFQGLLKIIQSVVGQSDQMHRLLSNISRVSMNAGFSVKMMQYGSSETMNFNIQYERISDAILEALQRFKQHGGDRGNTVSVNINGKEVFNAVVEENDRAIMRTGVSPLNR